VPFLRVLRDKRGYETTYLMHWFRDGGRQRSKILYVFRTPPGVKVGRDPIDPAIIREIEEQHPDIDFDWRALRENQQVIDTSPEARRPRPPARAGRPDAAEARRSRREEREKPAAERPAAERSTAEPPAARSEAVAETPPPPRLVIPTVIEGVTREDRLVFLLKWYLHLRERVPHRTHDPIRREALRALVERLNPEVWVGEEAIAAGLQDASEALQRLSALFAKRRKRSRRPKSDRAETGSDPIATGSDPIAAETGSDPNSRGPETGSDPNSRGPETRSDPHFEAEGSEFEPDPSE
jgi:hypothetical protein